MDLKKLIDEEINELEYIQGESMPISGRQNVSPGLIL